MIASPHALYVLLHVSSIVGTPSLAPFWAFPRFQGSKMGASTLCINPTRFGSFVNHQHWPCSTTRSVTLFLMFRNLLNSPPRATLYQLFVGSSRVKKLKFASDSLLIHLLRPFQSSGWIPIRFALILATLSLLKKFPPPPNHLPYRWFWGRVWHFLWLRITKPYSKTWLLKDLSLHSLISLRLFSAWVDFPIQAGLLLHGLPFVFAAARQVDIEREFFPHPVINMLDQSRSFLRMLFPPLHWTSWVDQLLCSLNRVFVDLIFGNVQPVATCPPKAFGKAVAIAAVRLLLNNLVEKLVPMQIFLSSSNGMGGNFGQVAFSAIPGWLWWFLLLPLELSRLKTTPESDLFR